MVRLAVTVLALGAVASACTMRDLVGDPPGEAQIVAEPWLSREIPVEAPRVYCYQTLADADCYTGPVAGRQPINGPGEPAQ